MNVKFDKIYGYENNKKSNLGYDTLEKIEVRTEHLKNYGTNDVVEFMKYIKNNYIWHVSGGGTPEELKEIQIGKFTNTSEYELYIWGGTGSDGYFTATLDYNRIGYNRCEEIKQEIFKALNSQFKNSHIAVTFEINHCLDKEKIENFILNYKFDINNLPIEKFSKINFGIGNFPKISKIAKEKFINIEEQFYDTLEGKNIIINGIEGRIKKVSEHATNNIHGYGFFKKRARSRFYIFSLNNINSLTIL